MYSGVSKLLIKLTLFLASLAAFDTLFSRLLDTGRPADYLAFIESKRDFDRSPRIDVLVLGDSHTADSVCPLEIRQRVGLEAFNFGVYHLSPLEGYYLLRDLLLRMERPPGLVILGTSPRMFTRPVTAGKYTPLFIKSRLILADLLTTSQSRNLALFTSAGKKLDLVNPMLDRWVSSQRQQPTRDVRGVDSGYLKNVRHYRQLEDLEPPLDLAETEMVKVQQEFLAKTIELLQSRGVEVMLVNPPLYNAYYDGIRESRTFRDFQTVLEDLTTNYQIELFNADNEVLRDELVKEDFLDGEHLCHSGATKFTRILADRLAATPHLAARGRKLDTR